MEIDRPDLSKVDPAVRSYIEALETEIERLRQRNSRSQVKANIKANIKEEETEEPYVELEPDEPPTTINLITATDSGIAKRTPRHLYSRQRRGGMGVFDLEAASDEAPAVLGLAEEAQSVLLITDLGRAFRLPVSLIKEAEVRGRGESITAKLNLGEGERLGAVLPILAQGYVALVGQTGMVRLLRHHVFGEYMKPGTSLFDTRSFSRLAGACWTPGDGELFIASKQGRAIRFSEKLVPPQGGLGIRLSDGDSAVAITGVYEDSGVFLLGEDGRGTIRLMEGFNPNKAPGAGGKIAMATDHLIGAARVEPESDIFVISRLSKIIRFRAAEVPAKEGVVQGVNCMTFRGDGVAAMTVTMPESLL